MRHFRKLVPMLAALAAFAVSVPAYADIGTSAEHAIIMDGETGQVLWAKDADTATPPASMSKLMTLELLFQRLKDGRVKLTDTFPGLAARLEHAGLEDVRADRFEHDRSRI